MADPDVVRAVMRGMVNSGHRPPNLTVTEDTHKNCRTCIHWNGRGRCRLYEYNTRPDQVCDDWGPQPT